MTPVEALCLACINHWLRIVRHKNGSCGEIDADGTAWTRCSATEVAAWIKKEFDADVSARQCQNALRSLEGSQRVIREKRWVNKWTQAYSYALPTTDQSSSPPPVDQQVTQDQPTEHERVDLSYGSTSSSPDESAVVAAVQRPEAQDTQLPDWAKPQPERHGVVRCPKSVPVAPKPDAGMDQQTTAIEASRTDEGASGGHVESGRIADVEDLTSHRLLGNIERATLKQMGVPDVKTDPAAYLNWVMNRREKQQDRA